ncbi:MAG: nucleotidyltransferase domain-containing protein [Myxococcales bacterium]|nr:nucleotidyltransferase domain-containing protein [Myxococcales bacterium]
MSLSPLEVQALAELRRLLAARFGDRLAGLTLFGSRARGEGHADSDLDVLVLVDGLTPVERREVLDLACDLELALRVAISPLVRPAAAPPVGALGREIGRDGVRL